MRLALRSLLLLQFHPASEAAERMRQCLAVFFPLYAGAAATHQRHLAAVLLPAARLSQGGPATKRSCAPQLIKYALQLLEVPPKSGEAGFIKFIATILLFLAF